MVVAGVDGVELLHLCARVAPTIVYFLPRNVDQAQAAAVLSDTHDVEVEEQALKGQLKTVTVYYTRRRV